MTAVEVDDDFFTPPDILVTSGATVTWMWVGGEGHNVTFASNAVSAPSITQTTGTFQVVMPTAAGVYNYECTIHAGMDGSVTVQ
jgi:plastocyanin